jgi:hypothetical protein
VPSPPAPKNGLVLGGEQVRHRGDRRQDEETGGGDPEASPRHRDSQRLPDGGQLGEEEDRGGPAPRERRGQHVGHDDHHQDQAVRAGRAERAQQTPQRAGLPFPVLDRRRRVTGGVLIHTISLGRSSPRDDDHDAAAHHTGRGASNGRGAASSSSNSNGRPAARRSRPPRLATPSSRGGGAPAPYRGRRQEPGADRGRGGWSRPDRCRPVVDGQPAGCDRDPGAGMHGLPPQICGSTTMGSWMAPTAASLIRAEPTSRSCRRRAALPGWELGAGSTPRAIRDREGWTIRAGVSRPASRPISSR